MIDILQNTHFGFVAVTCAPTDEAFCRFIIVCFILANDTIC